MSDAIRWSRLAAFAACLVVMAAVVTACGSSHSSSSSSASSASGSSSASSSTAATGTPKPGGSLTVLELGGYAGAWPAGLDPATTLQPRGLHKTRVGTPLCITTSFRRRDPALSLAPETIPS